jgi:alpha-methylacyl-CoA racemase
MATWSEEAGTNFLDSGAPYYDTFETADGGYVAVGALEEPFYVELLDRLGIPAVERIEQNDRARWPEMRLQLSEMFASRTRDEWAEAFEGSDACVTPVLSLDEAAQFRHNVVRSTYADSVGLRQPAAAPRFSRTPARAFRPASTRLADGQLDDLIGLWNG